MKFCKNCDNMLYLIVLNDGQDILQYTCKYCGYMEDITEEGIVVVSTNFSNDEKIIENYVNEYTKLDPALPRVSHIHCPNEGCRTNNQVGLESKSDEDIKRDIIYIRYDTENMKYLYLCCDCDHVWKAN